MQYSAVIGDSKPLPVPAGESASINILIADDQQRFENGGTQYLLDGIDGSHVEEAVTALETLQKLHEQPRDLLILNLGMSDQRGLELLRIVQATHVHTRVLVACTFTSRRTARHILRAGAHGYIDQRLLHSDELTIAVATVLAGKHFISDSLCHFVSRHDESSDGQNAADLSLLERQLFGKTLMGLSIPMLASEMTLSEKTVSAYQSRIMQKMGAESLSI